MFSELYVAALWQNHGLWNCKENQCIPSLKHFIYNTSPYIWTGCSLYIPPLSPKQLPFNKWVTLLLSTTTVKKTAVWVLVLGKDPLASNCWACAFASLLLGPERSRGALGMKGGGWWQPDLLTQALGFLWRFAPLGTGFFGSSRARINFCRQTL